MAAIESLAKWGFPPFLLDRGGWGGPAAQPWPFQGVLHPPWAKPRL